MQSKINVVGNIYVAGVYALKDANGVIKYIGSGVNCNDRLSSHLYFLKRNGYHNSNKQEIQDIYDRGELTFEIIKVSTSNSDVANMNSEQKKKLQEALSVLEEVYINLHKNTIVNCQKTVKKHTSNKDKLSTYKRRIANMGDKNPNNSFDKTLIANILFLKQIGLKPRHIIKLLEEQGIEMSKTHISNIGIRKWVYLEPIKPDWYNEDKIEA